MSSFVNYFFAFYAFMIMFFSAAFPLAMFYFFIREGFPKADNKTISLDKDER
jgi:hypothetical protein